MNVAQNVTCSRTPRVRVALGGVALLASAAGLWLVLADAPPRFSSPSETALADNGALPDVRWPEGTRHTYGVTLQSEDAARIVVDAHAGGAGGAGAAEAVVRFDGTLLVTMTGVGPGTSETDRVALAVARCQSARLGFNDAPLWADAAACETALQNRRIIADVRRDGSIAAVYDDSGDDGAVGSATAQSFLQTLIATFQLKLGPRSPDAATWSGAVGTPPGMATHNYRVESADPANSDTVTLRRQLVGYTDMAVAAGMTSPPTVDADGDALIDLDASGLIRRVESRETLVVTSRAGVRVLDARAAYTVVWQGSEEVDASRFSPTLAARALTVPPPNKNAARQLLTAQAAGLTAQELVASLSMYGNSGRFPQHERMMWRAVGLLKLHPEAARQLIPLYQNASASFEMRGLLLDLLASAGGEEAQAAMRAVLADGDILLEGKEPRQLYQRLGLLADPQDETVELVMAHHQQFAGLETRGEGFGPQMTTAYSLGALVEKRDGQGDDTGIADRANALLVEEALEEDDEKALSHRLVALGAAKRASNEDVLAGFAGHDAVKVRHAAARALGMGSRNSTVLREMLEDESPAVQRAAIDGLDPTSENLEVLRGVVERGVLVVSNAAPVVALGQKAWASHRSAAASLLRALLDHVALDARTREAVYALLARP